MCQSFGIGSKRHRFSIDGNDLKVLLVFRQLVFVQPREISCECLTDTQKQVARPVVKDTYRVVIHECVLFGKGFQGGGSNSFEGTPTTNLGSVYLFGCCVFFSGMKFEW